VEFTEEAIKTVTNMRDALSNVRHAIGEKDPLYVKMAESLAFSLAQMIQLGGTVGSDGPLSLYCNGKWITYGVNFHSVTHPQHDVAEFPMMKDNLGEWSVNS
jgi:hypothetical protein